MSSRLVEDIMTRRHGRMLGMIAAVLLVPPLSMAGDVSPNAWMLAAPDGGCTDLSVIRQKTRGLAKWNSPEELVNTLRTRDENVSTLTAKVEPGYVVKVVVPGRGIDVVFVPFSVCRAMWQEKVQRSAP